MIINAVIGIIQEGKAEKALNAIRRILSLEATVLRDGRRVDSCRTSGAWGYCDTVIGG